MDCECKLPQICYKHQLRLFSSVQAFANELSEEVKNLGIPAEVINMKDYDPDDQLADEVSLLLVLVFPCLVK